MRWRLGWWLALTVWAAAGAPLEVAPNGQLATLRVGDLTLAVNCQFSLVLRGEPDAGETVVGFADFELRERRDGRSVYAAKAFPGLAVETGAEIDDSGHIRFPLAVRNGTGKHVLRVRYPDLDNLRFTPGGAGDTLMWYQRQPRLVRAPASAPLLEPVRHPRTPMNWVDLSGGGRGVALIGDPDLVTEETMYALGSEPGSLRWWRDRIDGIPPGGSAESTCRLVPHDGDWHQAADAYRALFEQIHGRPDYPAWAPASNGFLAVYGGSFREPDYRAESDRWIHEAWRLGLDHVLMWGHTGTHACPGYPLPDPMRGGETLFMAMMYSIRRAGLHVGTYFFADGIGKYEVLAPSYRGVPWAELREEVRPPSWEWLVRNSAYPTPERTPPSRELNSAAWRRAGVATVEEAAARKLDPQVLHAMTFLAPEYRAWLAGWIGIYAGRYRTDTPYLDVFGFRPKNAEFNPHLNCFGNGTEGIAREAFLRELVATHRPQVPGFMPFMEGMADVYGRYAGGLASGLRHDLEVLRYTFPGQLLYEGNANGNWFPEASRRALGNAFVDGCRFDLMLSWCNLDETERLVWLREGLLPWVERGRYLGAQGFAISGPAMRGALTDARDSLGSSLLTFSTLGNALDGPATLTLSPELAGRYRYGVLLDLDGNATHLPDLSAPVELPATLASALVLVADASRQPLLPIVQPKQAGDGTVYPVNLVNLGETPQVCEVTVELADMLDVRYPPLVTETVEAAPLTGTLRVLRTGLGGRNPASRRLWVTVTAGDFSRRFRRTFDLPIEDLTDMHSLSSPELAHLIAAGTNSLAVPPKGRVRLPIKLAPRTAYRLTIPVRRDGETKGYAAIWDPRHKRSVGSIRETEAPSGEAWGKLDGTFTTEADGWLTLYLYNHGETGIVHYGQPRLQPADP